MGLLTNLLFNGQTGLGPAYTDPHTVYQDLLGGGGVLGGATSLDIPQVLEAAVGSGGIVDELFAGNDAIGLGYILDDSTIVGGLLADLDPFG